MMDESQNQTNQYDDKFNNEGILRESGVTLQTDRTIAIEDESPVREDLVDRQSRKETKSRF